MIDGYEGFRKDDVDVTEREMRAATTQTHIGFVAVLMGLVLCGFVVGWAEEADCTAAAPEPLLKKGVYAQQSFQQGKDNSATETADLSPAVKLRINYSGCADVVSKEFVFTVLNDQTSPARTDYWVAFVEDQLRHLQVRDEASTRISNWLKFVRQKQGAPIAHGEGVGFALCHDASLPGPDGCSFKSGGGEYFKVKTIKDHVDVIIGGYVLI